MQETSTVVFIVAALLLMTVGRLFLGKRDKQRTAEFMQVAKDLRIPFSNKGDRSLIKQFNSLWRFRRGGHSRPKNVFLEDKGGVQFTFFESQKMNRTSSSNQSGQRVLEGMFCFSSNHLDLPNFALHAAEELQQMFLDLLGFKDINFENHPGFSKKYLLNSDDEKAVRAFFNDELIGFLEGLDGFNIEGCGHQLMIYRPDVRVEPGEFRQLKQEASRIFDRFHMNARA
jgi:hypothetical protein